MQNDTTTIATAIPYEQMSRLTYLRYKLWPLRMTASL